MSTSKIALSVIAVIALVGGVVWATSAMSDDEMTSNDNESRETEIIEGQPNIVELAQDTPQLSTLVDAVVAAELAETLSGEGPYTVFAPTNDAFSALPEGTLGDLLMLENQGQLQSVLTYHVVAGDVMSGDLSDGQTIETLQGQTLTVSIHEGGVFINDAQVITADVDASNGVVHIIDSVLLPN